MVTVAKVLVVEDSASLAALYRSYLEKQGWRVNAVETGAQAQDLLQREVPDIVLLDLQLPDMNGLEVLRYVREHQLPSAVVVLTAHGSMEAVVESMRLGAHDFLGKPVEANRLIVTINNALQHQQLNRMVETYRENFDRNRYHGFIGGSLSMQGVYRIIESAAPSKATVFITGESGTGKELCAEAIHKQSPRRDAAFMAINCAAIPRDLMESEIFGHVKGAFTGANQERLGAASQADGGTLFLDEICEMDLDLQSKLLRFIQTGTFQRVGGSKLERVDVRFVCATNRDPLKEVQEGRFREDLYYRLHVIPIHLPALRQREGDVLAIARNFLRLYAKEENKAFERFSSDAEAILLSYDWPGNVRQLQNVVRNIVVLNRGGVVTPDMLPPPINSVIPRKVTLAAPEAAPAVPAVLREAPPTESANVAIKPLWQVEKETIERAVSMCEGNIPKAAALLEISASTIYRKRQNWDEQAGAAG
jgi:DNA-binding NtrC family response regulator